MRITATDFDAGDNGEFYYFGFYDSTAIYGIGFTRLHDDERIELMIADQSVYDLANAKVEFRPKYFKLDLPTGTINNNDGEDNYEVVYSELEAEEYDNMLGYLKSIFKGRNDIELKHS